MELGIEHLVVDLAEFQHLGEQLGDLYRCCADQHGATHSDHILDLLNHGGIFLLLGSIYAVVHIIADHRTIGRDLDDIELVDIIELARFGHGRTGHTGEFAIHTEVILQCDGGVGLSGSLHLNTLLGLDSLMEAIGIAAPLHDTSGLLIDDLDLIIIDHIFDILVE